MDSKKIGAIGQQYAEKLLKEKGYQLIEHNWRSKLGEVDLIGTDGDIFVFIEVKALVLYSPVFQPEDHLNVPKQRKLTQLALTYLNYKNIYDTPYRIDLVAVDLDRDLHLLDIRHYENIIEDRT